MISRLFCPLVVYKTNDIANVSLSNSFPTDTVEIERFWLAHRLKIDFLAKWNIIQKGNVFFKFYRSAHKFGKFTMKITLPILTAFLAATADAKLRKLDLKSLPAHSKAGRKLLSKARRLEDGDVDYSWLPGYTFQFQKCYSWEAYGRDDNEDKEKSIVFRACPQGDCSDSCKYGADYIVDLRDYVEAYTEAKQNLKEYNCEMVGVLL